MDDPLLSSLCSICRINVPKYTCPRCSVQTCSLPCSRRHKLWSSCNGIRDPTVYKPKSQLATPSGIDHDYNFLHSIEHQIERSEKRIIEDKGLIEKEELAAARENEDPDVWRVKMRKRKRQNPGQEPIERALRVMRTKIELAPKAMKRSMDNGTTWAKRQKAIHWQVEWIREGNAGRSLSKVMGNKPIGDAYSEFLEEERRNALSDAEKRLEKKDRERKAKDVRERLARGAKSDFPSNLSTSSILQDPQTGAWNSASTSTALELRPTLTESKPSVPTYNLYLLRPKTPSSFPKVFTPLNPTKTLEQLLRKRLVLEFPTVYVLKVEPKNLPDQFILEKDFLIATRQPPWQDSDTEMRDSDEDSSDADTDVSETSSSGSDSDEEMEAGELPKKE